MKDMCPICKRLFNDEPVGPLITDAFIDGRYIRMCPLCYADDLFRRTGHVWDPGDETTAALMFEEAKKQYPDWRGKGK